ncbi:uncharacterized protein LOC132170221 [Corylus avellana]|uniref:uncharacterized protein LOC132170221 n=1 Tax=Corylus avellana TaxID=13451 RepID=UPI00286A5EB4|nr:uncharacterized protein LOC132170221 [Corylus avellana]
MDDEAQRSKARKMIRRGAATLRAVALHVARFLIIMAILLGAIRLRFEAAVETQIYTDDEEGFSRWALCIGVVTIFLGFLFVALGIPILAYLFLRLSHRLQHQEEQNGTHPEGETTICEAFVGILVSVITVFLLLWAIYTGFRLATEPRGHSRYRFLTFSIGLVTIVFGFIYSIIGVAFILELVLDLSILLKQKEGMGGTQRGHSMIVKIFCSTILL